MLLNPSIIKLSASSTISRQQLLRLTLEHRLKSDHTLKRCCLLDFVGAVQEHVKALTGNMIYG